MEEISKYPPCIILIKGEFMDNRLFFVPYAGASSVTFKHWVKKMEPEVELEIFEMSGHGSRLFEDCYSSIEEAVKDFYSFLEKKLLGITDKYYLAGHCLGAVIIYETCILIDKNKKINLPERIFVSGHGSPEYIHDEDHVKDMSDRDMVDYFVKQGGMSGEYLNDELLELIVPPMKSDVAIYEDYRFDKNRDIPLVDMTVLYGNQDIMTPDNELEEWRKFSKDIDYVAFDDEHYFINSQEEKFLYEMKRRICKK
jgi:surfactin synthase thioesterase subunit